VIGRRAFAFCSSLETVHFGSAPELLADEAFLACVELKQIRLPDGMREIGTGAFAKCVSLETVYLPAELQKINARAFEKCALVSVSMPDTVTYVGDFAFADCYWLNTVLLPNRRVSIGGGVFSGCAGLEVLVMPEHRAFRWRKRERWKVPDETQIIYHSELKLSVLFAELASENTSEERKAALREEIRRQIRALRRRHILHAQEMNHAEFLYSANAEDEKQEDRIEKNAEDAAEVSDPKNQDTHSEIKE